MRTNAPNPAHSAVQITLAPEILAEIDRLAEDDMRSRSNYVQVLVTRTIQRMMLDAETTAVALANFHAAAEGHRAEIAPDGSTVTEA